MGGREDEGRVDRGGRDRRSTEDSPPPPEHSGPLWMNPKIVFPVLALIAAAIIINIVFRDPADPGGPGQSATITTGATTTSAATTTTVATSTTTTLGDPLSGLPDLTDFGGEAGLSPDDLDALARGLMPYDGTWWPAFETSQPTTHGPGIESYGWATLDLPGGSEGRLADVAPGRYDVAIVIFGNAPDLSGVPGSGNQIGVGIACETMPVQEGTDGLGGDGWTVVQFLDSTGYGAFLPGEGFASAGEGFGFAGGNLAVIGIPSRDCPYRVITNFYRDTLGDAAAPSDPAEYQFTGVAEWEALRGFVVGG